MAASRRPVSVRPAGRVMSGPGRPSRPARTSACMAPHRRSASASAAGSPGQLSALRPVAVCSCRRRASSRHMRAVKGRARRSQALAWDSRSGSSDQNSFGGQCRFDRRHQFVAEGGVVERADMLVDDGAVTSDEEGFGHPVRRPSRSRCGLNCRHRSNRRGLPSSPKKRRAFSGRSL